MAQALEIPTGRFRHSGNGPQPGGHRCSWQTFQITAPAGADPSTGSDITNMGPQSTGCKHGYFQQDYLLAQDSHDATCPRHRVRPKVNLS